MLFHCLFTVLFGYGIAAMISPGRTFSALGKVVWIWTDSVGALDY
jgi:hypothetical protein